MSIAAAAGGFNDHASGTIATTDSMYPCGSATKTYTAVSAMRLVEAGKLDLDAPVHQYIDPWNAKQSPPVKSLVGLWDGDTTINKVTSRQLLQMRSGLQEYDDDQTFKWTLANPDKDYLPMDFVSTLNKTFLFAPDEGGCYSSTGYVLMGMVLSALTDAPTWDQLDQLTAAGGAAVVGNNTLFMKQGHCLKYNGVTHSYIYQSSPYSLSSLKEPEPFHDLVGVSECKLQGYYKDTVGIGTSIKVEPAKDSGACCDISNGIKGAKAWVFQNSTCNVLSEIHSGKHEAQAETGILDAPMVADGFTDLGAYSCLNGWTMGELDESTSSSAS
jgi:hypothetical protein